ncbi:tetratricopeptide repeat protein [Candidatus Pelagibacter sp.]|uniref:class I SAM-dependent methyltransferase n=1 Tax=Candidatus Pelagibacter sp. TaxID=2024849 RepID=UPI003F854448
MKKISDNLLEPSQQQLNNLLKYYQTGQYDDAEKLSLSITQEFPKHIFAWKVLAAVLKQTGRINESLIISQKTVQLDPQDAKAHNNLGIIMKELGRLDEAEASYKQAIKLKPDLAEAYSNLGFIMQELGRLEEACSAFAQAVNLKPDFTDAYANLAFVIKNVRFTSSNIKFYPPLIYLLNNGNYIRPSDLAPSILSLLKHDPIIKDLLLEENFATNLKEANSIISRLDKLTLLHQIMRVCRLPDLRFEKFFLSMRSLFITNLDNFEASPEFIHFLSSLSLHCFTNEYIYIEKDKETKLVKNLETEITETISRSEQPEAKKILCLASYRPLNQYNWFQKLKALDNLEEVKSRLIEEPSTERETIKAIPILSEISDSVSSKVREQYEENPYPRWVKIGLPLKARLISEICSAKNLHLNSKSIQNEVAPNILVAGCGTGQHSIETASTFSDCQVTAVDLSLASLAYAKRKTSELGINNIEYLQADILNLNQLKKKFDIIESVGVLHHMDEPMVGWRVLTDLLKPNGLMRIGLYSELARLQITEVRKEITSQKVGTSDTDIKKFRQLLINSHNEHHQLLTKSSDFFSLSTFRDLIFHVQEHCFTIPQIKKCLNKLGLKFCGFENKEIISNFRNFHGKELDIYDLALWHQFEENNPRSFGGMYVFWCQKL